MEQGSGKWAVEENFSLFQKITQGTYYGIDKERLSYREGEKRFNKQWQ